MADGCWSTQGFDPFEWPMVASPSPDLVKFAQTRYTTISACTCSRDPNMQPKEKTLKEREAKLKAQLRKLKEQRRTLKERMKRVRKEIKELKGPTLNTPQDQDRDDGSD
jgi:uncharacterized protein YlxW (UPF0749 family)